VSNETCNGLDDNCDGQIDEAAGCPCTHRLHGKHAYLFCHQPAYWNMASADCSEYGYHLVIVDDLEENAWIFGMGDVELGLNWWFIGLTDVAMEGKWARADGTPVVFENWQSSPSEPNGGPNENCAAMGYYVDGTWDDTSCSNFIPYVCEAGPE
jgi:hypothetical protein